MSDGYLQQMIAHNLVTYRQERDLSQEAFAELLGMHPAYVGGVERGEHNLTLRSVERIARQLDVHTLDLVLGRDEARLLPIRRQP